MDFSLSNFEGVGNATTTSLECSGCGGDFSITLGEIKRRVGTKTHFNLYCTTDCREESRGEKHDLYFPEGPTSRDSYGRVKQPLHLDDDWQNRYYHE